jgi:cell division septal protein FtsQ
MRRGTIPPNSAKAETTKPKRARSGSAKNKTSKPAAPRKADGRKPAPSLVLPPARVVSAEQRRSQQQARRRRQNARHVRRFEALVSHLPRASFAGISPPAWLPTARWQPSHLLSLLLVLVAVGGIGWVHYDEEWYVYEEHVTFTGLTYQEAEELYPLLGVDGWNVFWLSAPRIREKLVALPTIADAQVHITPPHWVVIDIEEAEPVALWVTQEGELWLLPDGTALPKTDERYDALPRIIDHLREASAWDDPQQQRVDHGILTSALALLQQVPTIDNLYFNAGYGLNFHMPGSDTWVYWGDGSNAEQKYNNLLAIQQDLRTQEQVAAVVDIRFDKPVIR